MTTADLAPITGTGLFPRTRAKFTETMLYTG